MIYMILGGNILGLNPSPQYYATSPSRAHLTSLETRCWRIDWPYINAVMRRNNGLVMSMSVNMAFVDQAFRFVHNYNLRPALMVSPCPCSLILVHFIPWLVGAHCLRSFPGPWVIRFSGLWLGRVAQRGHRSEVVHEMHQKYGELHKHVVAVSYSQSHV